ncbi:hypothetical protein I204_06089 [Kwoniella mangroviensis CBS 8886]|nr:hypothetical protein I204_06089 [Kwoniella mangroviensis CBS 8886]
MDHRRRTSVTSTSTIRSARESSMQVKNLRSPSIGSATPKMEDEEDGKPRRTRGRNPLPPTTGPLFPPLPPKQPKNSPKNSPQAASRSPAVRTPSGLAPPPDIVLGPPTASTVLPTDSAALEEDAISARSVSPDVQPEAELELEKLPVQSLSNASLTPPPPTSEDTNPDPDPDPELEPATDVKEQKEGEGKDDWEDYRRHRTVRSFGNVSVKEEPGLDDNDIGKANEDGNEEVTPVHTRSYKRNGLNIPPGSGENTPLATTPLSNTERSGSASRQTRKRRGEDELLLDDHLLPAEIRRTSFSSKKQKKEKEEEEEQKVEEHAVEVDDEQDEQKEDQEEEEEEGEEEEEEEEEEVKDVTRCVCHKEDIDVMMIQCDQCNVWQHGECMGIWGDEEAPDEYFCEECKPERHQPLLKWIRRLGRKSGGFVPPSPENLENLHNDRDDYPPSQSKRWPEGPSKEAPEPTPPPKPLSRSHHKRQATSPQVETQDGRRSTRGRQPAPSITRDKPPSSSGKNDAIKSHTGRRVRGISSISPDLDSNSPQPLSAKEPKRRSTMNSRDAAYEEEVKAALEASRAEMLSPPHETDEVAQAEEKEKERGEKRRRDDEDEAEDKERTKKGKRKRDEDEGSVEPSNLSKPKHPNQYTYRKPPSTLPQQPPAAAPSPARRVAASTPVPIAQPAQHEHGTRRAGALAAAPVVYHPLTPESANHLSWFLPDHLSAFADLLPSTNPNALEVPAPRVLSYLPRNHYHNQRYGPFSEERDENGKLVLPDEPSGREVVGDQNTAQLDPPARPRYPVKRITTAEMKKRVRNVLEYVGRVQVEEGKRQERARLLGIKLTKVKSAAVDGDLYGDVNMEEEPQRPEEEGKTSSPMPEQTKSMQLMDELTQDLINFQESFNSSGNGNGYASPMPLTTSTFSNGNGGIDSVPPTPTLPNDPTVSQLSVPTTAVPSEVTTEAEAELSGKNVLKQGEGMDVYRQGIVSTVITTEEEKDAAEKVGEILAQAEEGIEA